MTRTEKDCVECEEKGNAEEPGKDTTTEEGEDAPQSSEQSTFTKVTSAASGMIQGAYNRLPNWPSWRQSERGPTGPVVPQATELNASST